MGIATPLIFEPVREIALATKKVVKQDTRGPPNAHGQSFPSKQGEGALHLRELIGGLLLRVARSKERTREPGLIHSLGLQIQSLR